MPKLFGKKHAEPAKPSTEPAPTPPETPKALEAAEPPPWRDVAPPATAVLAQVAVEASKPAPVVLVDPPVAIADELTSLRIAAGLALQSLKATRFHKPSGIEKVAWDNSEAGHNARCVSEAVVALEAARLP